MPQKLFDWLQLPTWDGVEPYRRMLADVLGFPATPTYDSKEDTDAKPEQPKLLTANVRTSPNSPRKKRHNKKRKRQGRGR